MRNKLITKEVYNKRIQIVMEYIHNHLDEDLSLDRLAEIACFSPFHWHRIYQGITGESIKRTITRLRLFRAAKSLIDTENKIASIAKKAGYENTDSFTRKFSSEFDIPPLAYRKRGKLIAKQIKQPIKENKDMYKVEIKQLADIRLATRDHMGDYFNIGAEFDKLFAWGANKSLLNSQTRTFGIYYDNPQAIEENLLRSKAGFSVNEEVEYTDGVNSTTIKSGKYAMIIHKGDYIALKDAYNWLFGVWLPDSNEEPADNPVVEEYLNSPREVPPKDLLTAVYIPLK